jgi:hypothetical protein
MARCSVLTTPRLPARCIHRAHSRHEMVWGCWPPGGVCGIVMGPHEKEHQPMSSQASSQRERTSRALHDNGSVQDRPLDDWGAFFDDVPGDLVYECILDGPEDTTGIAIYRDHVILEGVEGVGRCSCSREELVGWSVGEPAGDVVAVEIKAQTRLRVRVPATVARAVVTALSKTFGSDPRS